MAKKEEIPNIVRDDNTNKDLDRSMAKRLEEEVAVAVDGV